MKIYSFPFNKLTLFLGFCDKQQKLSPRGKRGYDPKEANVENNNRY